MKETFIIIADHKGRRFDEFTKMIHKEFPHIPWHFIQLKVLARSAGPVLLIEYKKTVC